MNKSKFIVGLLFVVVVVLFTPASHAQACPNNPTVLCPIVAVGSSAIFPSAALASVVGDPIRGTGPLCGTRFWSGSASGIDSRTSLTTPTIPAEGGTLWVSWDSDAAPTIICAYLSVDSIVGQRLFYGTAASGNGTLSIPVAACTTAGANKVSFIWDTATGGLPLAVHNALQGNTGGACAAPASAVHFNVAFTDIRSEDAYFVGNQRVLAPDTQASAAFPPDDKSALGYGGGGAGGLDCTKVGPAVLSSYSGSSAQSVCYNFIGGANDPISTSSVIPQSQSVSVGALSMLVFVNNTNTTLNGGGFGDLIANKGLTNVTSHTLSGLYSPHNLFGGAFVTRDVLGANPSLGIAAVAVHALAREPQSGTYTTFEWQVVRQRDGLGTANSQEANVLGPTQAGFVSGCAVNPVDPGPAHKQTVAFTFPPVDCSNYMSWRISPAFPLAMKSRVFGTGEMVAVSNINCATAVLDPGFSCNVADTLGYAFWSLGSFGNKTNITYLTLDGSDALFPSYSTHNGAFPPGDSNQGKTPIVTIPTPGCGGYFNGDGGLTITNFKCNTWTLPTFDNIQNGNYRLWNINRANYYGASPLAPSFSPLNITGFILSAQNQAAPLPAKLPDFLPVSYCGNAACSSLVSPMNVFRSHYVASSWGLGATDNGIISGHENGGDVAGAVINVQSEKDGNNFFGATFVTWVQ